jgi:hypothetical protein
MSALCSCTAVRCTCMHCLLLRQLCVPAVLCGRTWSASILLTDALMVSCRGLDNSSVASTASGLQMFSHGSKSPVLDVSTASAALRL